MDLTEKQKKKINKHNEWMKQRQEIKGFTKGHQLDALIESLPVPIHPKFIGRSLTFQVPIIEFGSQYGDDGGCNEGYLSTSFETIASMTKECLNTGLEGSYLEDAICIARCYFQDQADKCLLDDGSGEKEQDKADQWKYFFQKAKEIYE